MQALLCFLLTVENTGGLTMMDDPNKTYIADNFFPTHLQHHQQQQCQQQHQAALRQHLIYRNLVLITSSYAATVIHAFPSPNSVMG